MYVHVDVEGRGGEGRGGEDVYGYRYALRKVLIKYICSCDMAAIYGGVSECIYHYH